jgi:serine/threonine-protein kinase
MSPEQLAGDKLDGRSDIYSLGLVAFNCLTGKLPFPSDSAQEAMIMRLTDRPQTLAEVRSDIEWPEAVQATLDRALARDVTERYQGAAQFGREFAEAVSAMPATQAAEGATMVIGAQGAPAGAAAVTKPVPATRVDRGARTPAKGAAPAPVAKRSPVPMLAGGGVLVAAAIVGYLKFMAPAGGTPAADPATAAAASDTTGGKVGGTQNPITPFSRGETLAPDPVNPGGTPVRTNTQTTPANPGTGNPPAPSVMTRLEGWVNELQAPDITRSAARRILGDVETLRSTLAGSQLAESWYVTALANTALEDQDGTCAAAREIKRLHRERSRIEFADLILPNCQ